MKKNLLLVMLCASSLLLSSCMTLFLATMVGSNDAEQKSALNKLNKKFNKDWNDLSPDKYALVYGKCEDFLLYQQNPELGYKFYESYSIITADHEDESYQTSDGTHVENYYSKGTVGYIKPVPVKSEFAISKYISYGDIATIYFVNGIQGVDFVVTKPGLYYLDYWDEEHTSELDITKDLLRFVKGSEWESTVQKRIEELEK